MGRYKEYMEEIVIKNKGGQSVKKYKAICPSCGKDKGFVFKKDYKKKCRSCARVDSHLNMSEETKKRISKKVSEQFQGCSPWNKGKKNIYSEDLIAQWKNKHKEIMSKECNRKLAGTGKRNPWLKGKEMSLDTKIKISCANLKIEQEQFIEFKHIRKNQDRYKFEVLKLSGKTFIRDDHTCQCCSVKGTTLHAHHMNSFAHYPEQRFELNNLVTLCNHCHNLFHKKYGNGKATPNTKEQFLEFKAYVKNITKKDVILLCGAPASGKSWVGKQLTKYSYISHDDTSSKNLIYSMLNADKPIVYDPTIGISTFMKNTSHYFNFKLIVIEEDIDVIKNRMLSRDGKITPTIEKRCKRMRQLSNKAIFSGTSEEVLKYLQA